MNSQRIIFFFNCCNFYRFMILLSLIWCHWTEFETCICHNSAFSFEPQSTSKKKQISDENYAIQLIDSTVWLWLWPYLFQVYDSLHQLSAFIFVCHTEICPRTHKRTKNIENVREINEKRKQNEKNYWLKLSKKENQHNIFHFHFIKIYHIGSFLWQATNEMNLNTQILP